MTKTIETINDVRANLTRQCEELAALAATTDGEFSDAIGRIEERLNDIRHELFELERGTHPAADAELFDNPVVTWTGVRADTDDVIVRMTAGRHGSERRYIVTTDQQVYHLDNGTRKPAEGKAADVALEQARKYWTGCTRAKTADEFDDVTYDKPIFVSIERGRCTYRLKVTNEGEVYRLSGSESKLLKTGKVRDEALRIAKNRRAIRTSAARRNARRIARDNARG